MGAAADVGQSVVAAILGLGAAGVAGGIVAMAWSVHIHQLQLAERLARRPMAEMPQVPEQADAVLTAHAANGHRNGNGGGAAAQDANGTGAPAIEGPDSVIIGEQARYRVRRSGAQRVVSWAAGGGAVSQASDPAHPDDLLLVAAEPGIFTVSVRLREGLAERRETIAVTAMPDPATAAPAVASRLFLQDWPLATVAVVVAGFAAALVALGSLGVSDFIALVAPLAALLVVVGTSRKHSERTGPSPH